MHLQALANDGFIFVRSFGMVMAKSASQIYLYALPFAPTSLLIAVQYSQMFPHTLSVKCGKLSHWPTLEMMIEVGKDVTSVAFSPDGQHIVSKNSDEICVWNAATGEIVAGPFTEDSGCCAVFSPNGQYIVSASSNTICVWNVATGEREVRDSFFKDINPWCVTFAPDGQYIVSGTYDNTIHIWNTAIGEIVAGSFTGHTGLINSVAFSPDG
jgi:WD40 repeat protein